MTPQRRRRVEDLFAAAADLAPSERAAYLDRACGDDDALRREVEVLLEHDARAGDSFLGGVAGDARAREPLPTPCIGPYKLLGLIGEGGFGSVYLAEQTAPVRRRVALKVVKLGMDTRQVVARFEAERQAMALLEHPGIARVLDAGTTEHGRPYVVMEHVPGVPITDYCEAEQLDTDARLALFLLVCDAVQHAHQRGIIHRDLKPSNILVEVIDGAAVPKIIDFGIAKAIGGTLTDRTLMTEQGQLVGTPEYMSPEQAEMSPLGVDTRTDIYALGVVLYELLVGALPWEPRTLRGGSIADIQRRIREEQPVRPSTRLRSAASLASDAVRRRATATQRGRRLRGDLDWITLKAMEKERSRRYASASEFAADIRRHLAHEPVQAGPPSATYRAWKFVRRHRAGVIAGSVAVAALLAALVGISWGLVHTRAARDAALESQRAAEAAGALASRREAEAEHLRELESDLRAAAEAEARRARAVTSFLVDTLALGDPSVAGRPDIPMRDVLDLAARRVGVALADMPAEQAAVRATIGRAYLWMGDPALANLHLSRAVELLDARRADPAVVYPVLLSQWRAMEAGGDAQAVSIGSRLWNTQVQLLTRADAELGAVCAAIQQRTAKDAPDPAAVAQVRRRAESLDPEDSTRRLVAEFLALCGGVELRYGSERHAAVYFEEAARAVEPAPEPLRAELEWMDAALISSLSSAGRLDDAEARARANIDHARRVYGENPFALAPGEMALARTLLARSRCAEALDILEACAARLAALDAATYDHISCLALLADAQERCLSPGHAAGTRALLLDALARSWFLPGLDLERSALGPEGSPLVAWLDRLIAAGSDSSLPDAQRAAAVTALLDELDARRDELLPPDGAAAAVVARRIHILEDNWEETWLRQPLTGRIARLCMALLRGWEDRTPLYCSAVRRNAIAGAIAAGDPAEAERLGREMLALAQRVHPPRPGWPGIAQSALGSALLAAGKHAEAENVLRSAYESMREELGESNGNTVIALQRLILACRLQGRTADLGTLLTPAMRAAEQGAWPASRLNTLAWEVVRQPGADPETLALAARLADAAAALEPADAAIVNTLGVARFRTGDFEGALRHLRRSDELLRAQGRPGSPSDWAYIALSLHALGREDEALDAMRTLRRLMAQTDSDPSEDSRTAFDEARAVLGHLQ